MASDSVMDSTPSNEAHAAAEAIEAEQVKRPRIKTIEICDFRAFPGPTPVVIELGGKNLFLFGENGVGKSTIFQALDGLFAYARSPSDLAQELQDQANRFTPIADKGKGYVRITYDDNKLPAEWSSAGHPADTNPGPANKRVVNAALAKAILDYRSLLQTNYDHGVGEVNLFGVCVDQLLRDYVTVTSEPIGALWQTLNVLIKEKQLNQARKNDINEASRRFNDGLAEALEEVLPFINPILEKLGYGDIRVEKLLPKRIAYNNSSSVTGRAYRDCEVAPEITFQGQAVAHPQLFLNEARLSALALAIYFAGRRLAEKQTKNDMPRIMVLDDVLIGLDQANRVPLLDVLAEYFQNWQVIILTHDRVWFDIARHYQRVLQTGPAPADSKPARAAKNNETAQAANGPAEETIEGLSQPSTGAKAAPVVEKVRPARSGQADKYWTYWQLHQPADHHFAPIATNVDSSVASQVLTQARRFLKDGHVHAAGNAARLATEYGLREFCASKEVLVPYVAAPGFLPASSFLERIEAWDTKKHYASVLSSIRMYTTILLNPLSHGGTPEVTPSEVTGAIEVVDKLLFTLKVIPTAEMKRRRD